MWGVCMVGARKREQLPSHHIRFPTTPPHTQHTHKHARAHTHACQTRLEKERAAVLSEMSMVNTIEYRVECAILQVGRGIGRQRDGGGVRVPLRVSSGVWVVGM